MAWNPIKNEGSLNGSGGPIDSESVFATQTDSRLILESFDFYGRECYGGMKSTLFS